MTRARRLRAAAVAVALCLALATACSGGDAVEADEPDPGTTSSGAPQSSDDGTDGGSEGDGTAAPVADPEHAVDPPGRRTGALVGPDLRIYSKEPLSDELVKRIAGFRRVERVERISLGDFGVQNGVITVAAVDPATYRNYTPYASAELQEVWDRLAAGELAIDKAVGRRLQDRAGYSSSATTRTPRRSTSGPTTRRSRRSTRWSTRSGARSSASSGNALLVYTGIHSPRDVRKDLVKLVGDDASITILGPNLDPGATQTAVLTGGSVADAVDTFRYTVLGVAAPRPSSRGSAPTSAPRRCRSSGR